MQRSSTSRTFFRWEEAYRDHSRQLAEAIPKWLDRMNFTECEYKYGTVYFQKQIEASNIEPNKVPYVEELRSHLEIGYPEIINRYRTIQRNDEQRSLRIKEMMSAQYRTLHENLVHDDDKIQLRNDLRRLYSDINGGKPLQGYEACHLCSPRPS